MERTAWTDQRLGDMSNRIDAGFARIDADIRELRTETGAMRRELGGEIGGLRSAIEAMQITMIRVGGGVMAGLVGVIGAVLLGGA